MRLKNYAFALAFVGLGGTSLAQTPDNWLEFNGEDQYVTVPSHADFDINQDEDLTITCWVNLDQFKKDQRFVARRHMNQGNNQTTGYEMWGGGSSSQYFAINTPKTGGGNILSEYCNVGTGATGTWMHLAMVISHTGGYVAMFRDGVQANTSYSADLASWSVSNGLELTMGATRSGETGYAYFFDGKLADVRVWKKALTQEEIAADMTAEVGEDTEGLVAAYDFQNIEGTTLPDISGNGHDGTLHGYAPVSSGEASIYSVQASGDTNFTGCGNNDEVAVKVELETIGEGDYAFQTVKLDLGGTTSLSDIEAVKVYSTTSDKFDARNLEDATLLGTFKSIEETMTCDLSGSTAVGSSYLYVTFDVAEGATEGNQISIRLTELDGKAVEMDATSREVLLARTLVFAPGDYNSMYYRIPGIITAKDGSLVAVTDARKYNQGDLPGDIDVTVRRSTDGGKTWSEPVIIAKGQGQNRGYGDAALVQTTEEGGLLCIFAGANGLGASTPSDPIRTYYSKSTDNGVTWSEPVDITDQIYGAGCSDTERASWQASFCASGRGLLTSKGRIMFVAAIRHYSYNNTLYNHVVYSDDNGATWHVSDVAMEGGDESKVVELNDGTILMSIRRQGGGARFFNTSKDNGETWGNHSEWPELLEPGCNGDIVRYTSTLDGYDKDRILHTLPNDLSSRQNVTMFLSYDEGKTWPFKKTVCKTGSAYSSATILNDGTIGVYLEENYNTEDYSTYFLNFSLDWLTDGADTWAEQGVEAVAAPEFSVPGGKYTTEQTVEITTATEGAQIYYTTDGTTPTEDSELYTEPLKIFETTTLKAIAMKEGMANSSMTVATYSFFEYEIPQGTTHDSEQRYITSATTEGAMVELDYSNNSNPGTLYVKAEEGFTVKLGSTFELNVTSTSDMKWCHAIVWIDWNCDYDFDDDGEELFKVGSDVNDADAPGKFNVIGNTEVPDFTRTITVPATAVLGKSRVRIQFTDAWHIKGVDHPDHSATDKIDKGRVYDFDMTISDGSPRLTIEETEHGTITVVDDDTNEPVANGDKVNLGQFLRITFTPDKGYELTKAIIDGEDMMWCMEDNIIAMEVVEDYGMTVSAEFDLGDGIASTGAESLYYDEATSVLYVGDGESLRIYDVTGRTVVETQVEPAYDASQLKGGIYIAVVDGQAMKFRK